MAVEFGKTGIGVQCVERAGREELEPMCAISNGGVKAFIRCVGRLELGLRY
jgi:hypothetical protein